MGVRLVFSYQYYHFDVLKVFVKFKCKNKRKMTGLYNISQLIVELRWMGELGLQMK